MSKVLVDRELLDSAATWLEVHAPGGGCVEGSVAEDLRAILEQPAEAEGVEVVAYVGCQARMTTEGWENGEEYLVFADQASDADKRYDVPLMTVAQHLAALAAVTAERDRLREDAERWRYVSLQGDDTHWLNLLRVDLEDFGGNINAAVDALIDGEAPAMAAKEA